VCQWRANFLGFSQQGQKKGESGRDLRHLCCVSKELECDILRGVLLLDVLWQNDL